MTFYIPMAKAKSNISNYNLFFLFFGIIWDPLQYYYLHVDGAGRIMMTLSMVAVILNIGKQKNNSSVFVSPAFICWSVLMVYSIINSWFKGFVGDYGFFIFIRGYFLEPYVFLWIIIIELMRNEERCFHVLLMAMLLYMLIGASHLEISENDTSRMEAVGLGNALPLMAVTSVFVASILFVDGRLKGTWKTLGVIVFFSFFISMIVATRKAFGAIVIILIGMLLGRLQKINVKSTLTIVVVAIVIIVGFNYVLDHTTIGQRMIEGSGKYDLPISSNPKINNVLMKVLGDRAMQYYEGILIHKSYPITGIGIGNYQRVSGAGYRFHTEYMVQYCENGLVGFFLLLAYYVFILIGLFKAGKKGQNLRLCFFGLLTVLFLNLTAWTFDLKCVMIIYAILLTRVYSKQSFVQPTY